MSVIFKKVNSIGAGCSTTGIIEKALSFLFYEKILCIHRSLLELLFVGNSL